MQDVHREMKQGVGDTPSCMGNSGRRQIKGFRKSLKLNAFTRPSLPEHIYVVKMSRRWSQTNHFFFVLYVFWT